ncbi:MAG: tetratricopeptide repeat protein [Anaerolineae bacterium]|nr:tetratricopeptide repeat protein [Anaerolineae bacterium]
MSHRVPVHRGDLPLQPTQFIGREEETARVMEMLADSYCRLLTLTGEGGIGKSRLALEIASKSLSYYPDGVYFVDLQAIYTKDTLMQAVADALNCPLSGHHTVFEQVLHFLREKDMLLLLDNFEQLLPEQAEVLVSDLLNDCLGLTIIVTSREVLNLRQEWVWRVSGLEFPQEQTVESPKTFDAVRLFMERARRVRSDFLVEYDLPHVLHICRLVEGMPLAIELAACWLKVLPCKAIAEEIRQSLDLLNSHQHDLPERHRSIRAVFEHGWKLLSPSERETINRLSIFKGGFRREAAEQVAGADLATLLLLTDKSLLRLEANGRFHIHELVRQYAAEQLGDVETWLDMHCAHYADFLQHRDGDLSGGRQIEASDEIGEEIDNIRAAWEHAVKRGNFQALSQMTTAYSLFCQFRSRYQEAYNAYSSAIKCFLGTEVPPEADRMLGTLLSALGWMCVRMGQLDNAESAFEQAEMAFNRLGIGLSLGYGGDPALGRAVAALVRGDYGEAERLAEQAIQASETAHNTSSLIIACRTLGEVYLRMGKPDIAHQHALRAYQLCEETGDRWFMAYCLTTLGEVALEMEVYAAAKKHFESAYLLRQEFHDPEGMAMAMAYLGDIVLQQQSLDEALHCYNESRMLYQQINDPGGLARVLCGLSRTHLSLRDYPAAAETCRKGLQITVKIQYIPVLLQLLIIAGELCYTVQNQSRGLEVLALVVNHAASTHTNRTAVQQFLARHNIAQLPSLLTGHDLQNIGSLLQMGVNIESVLLEVEDIQGTKSLPDPSPVQASNQSLLDPLTPRELEVLSYIITGLQNREIADKLVVSLNTVKTHINNIYSKLNITNRVQAVARARELGII